MDIDKKRQELLNQNKQDLKRGLGDTIEEVFKKTGISYIAKKALGEDCGCDKRKEKLNKMFPYKKNKEEIEKLKMEKKRYITRNRLDNGELDTRTELGLDSDGFIQGLEKI